MDKNNVFHCHNHINQPKIIFSTGQQRSRSAGTAKSLDLIIDIRKRNSRLSSPHIWMKLNFIRRVAILDGKIISLASPTSYRGDLVALVLNGLKSKKPASKMCSFILQVKGMARRIFLLSLGRALLIVPLRRTRITGTVNDQYWRTTAESNLNCWLYSERTSEWQQAMPLWRKVGKTNTYMSEDLRYPIGEHVGTALFAPRPKVSFLGELELAIAESRLATGRTLPPGRMEFKMVVHRSR